MPVQRLVRYACVVEATNRFPLLDQREMIWPLILKLRASFKTAITRCKSTRAESVVSGVKVSSLRRGSVRPLIITLLETHFPLLKMNLPAVRLLELDIELLAPSAFLRLLRLACGAPFSDLLPQPEHYEVLSNLPTPAVPLHPLSELLDPLHPRAPPPLFRQGSCLRPVVPLLGEGRRDIVGIEDGLIIGVVKVVDVSCRVLVVRVSRGGRAKRGGRLGQVVGVQNRLINLPDSFIRLKKAAA